MIAFTRLYLLVILASLAIIQTDASEDSVQLNEIADIYSNTVGGRIEVSYHDSNGNIVDQEVPVEGNHHVVWPSPQWNERDSRRY